MTAINGNNIKSEHYASWLDKPSMRRLLTLEADWLGGQLAELHGMHLVYAGIDPNPQFIKRCRTQYKSVLTLPWAAKQADNSSAFIQDDAWPLPDDSVDVVILQHSLEMSAHPHQLMREAVRCVVPNGYVLVSGFNPYSLFGLARWALAFSSSLPWMMRPVSPTRIHDWFTLLDLKVEQTLYCAHLWPLLIGSEKMSQRIDRVLAGNFWLPSNAYVMVARKTVAGITPIRPLRWMLSDQRFIRPVAVSREIDAASARLYE